MAGTELHASSGNEGVNAPVTVEQGKKENTRREVIDAVVKVRNLWRQKEDTVYDAHTIKVNGVETRIKDYTPEEQAASGKFENFDRAYQELGIFEMIPDNPADPNGPKHRELKDFKKSYTREIKDADGKTVSKVQEGLPTQPLLDFLSEEITAAEGNEAKGQELKDLQEIIDRNSPKTYDAAHGVEHAQERTDEAALRIAKENGRTEPNEEDKKQAKNEIINYRVLTVPSSPLEDAGLDTATRENPGNALQILAEKKQPDETTTNQPADTDTDRFDFRNKPNFTMPEQVIVGQAPQNLDTRLATTTTPDNSVASTTDTSTSDIPTENSSGSEPVSPQPTPNGKQQVFVNGQLATPLPPDGRTDYIEGEFRELPLPSTDEQSRQVVTSDTRTETATSTDTTSEQRGESTSEDVARRQAARAATVSTGTSNSGEAQQPDEAQSSGNTSDGEKNNVKIGETAENDNAGNTVEKAGESERKYPYWKDSETDKGFKPEEIKTLYAKEWEEVTQILTKVKNIVPNTANKPKPEFEKELLDALADRLKNPGKYDGKNDAINSLLRTVQIDNADNVLMAAEAQAAITQQQSSKEAWENLQIELRKKNRREVRTEVSRESARANVQGGYDSYYNKTPLTPNGETGVDKDTKETFRKMDGGMEAKTMPQRDLYAFALIADRLMDITNPIAGQPDQTYRKQMQDLEAIARDDVHKSVAERQAASRELMRLRTSFYEKTRLAMEIVDDPTHDTTDQIIMQMQEKLREARGKKVEELAAAYQGVGRTADGLKLSPEKQATMVKALGGEGFNRDIMMYAMKGGDLMLRRTGGPSNTETSSTPSLIKRKIFVQGPNGEQPGGPNRQQPTGEGTLTPGPTDGGKKGSTTEDNGNTPGDDGKKPGEGLPPAPGDTTEVTIPPVKEPGVPPVAPPEGGKPGDDTQTPEQPPVAPEGEGSPKIKIGIVNRTEAAGQLGEIRVNENINAGLRRRGWARFTNWMRRISEVPDRFRQRERVMAILNGTTYKRLIQRETIEATAAAVRAELNASASGTVERFKNMTTEQAQRYGKEGEREEVRELTVDSPLRRAIWDRMLRTMVVNGETWDADRVRTTLRDIVRDFPDDADAQAIRNAPNRYADRAQEFASDILEMAKVVRAEYLKNTKDKDGNPISEEDRLKAIDKRVVFILGSERAAAHESGRGVEENAYYWAKRRNALIEASSPFATAVNKMVLSPLVVGSVTAICTRGWRAPVKVFGKFAAPLSPFTPLAVGSLAAGVAAGARKWQEANRDYWTVNKDVAYNRRSVGPEAKNRKELEEIHDKRGAVTAETLHSGGGADVVTGRDRRKVTDILADLKSGDADKVTRANQEARSRLAEIIKRQEMSAEIHKNLITFSSVENYSKESANLTKDENELIRALDIDQSQPNWYNDLQANLQTELSRWANLLTPNQQIADKRMRGYRLKRALAAGAISAGTGFVGGVIGQKVVSSARAAIDQIRTGQPQYVGPTLFDRMGKGAVEHSDGFRNTAAGQWLENKFSVPPSIDSFKDAFKTGHDVSLPNGFRVHPETSFMGNERHLWLLDQQGTPVLDSKGNALNVPMFVRQDGSIVVHGDITNTPDVPGNVKALLNGLPHHLVDSPVEVTLKQALTDANAGKPAFFDMPNPVTHQVDRVQVLQGGKFWLPSAPHVMGQIQPDGSVKFSGSPVEMKSLHDALNNAGMHVGNVTEQTNAPLHDRISALIKSQPGGGEMMTDEGKIKISYDGNGNVLLTDMSDPAHPSVNGGVYWETEKNPTNVPRPGGPRGELANFKFLRGDFAHTPDSFQQHLKEAGFTGQGFNAPGGVNPTPEAYTMPLGGNEIALAAPDTSVNAVMSVSLPKDMLITPPTVHEPWPAIPLPFDPRRPLEGYGTPVKAESITPKPKKEEPKKTKEQTEVPTPAPVDSTVLLKDAPEELQKDLQQLYKDEKYEEAIAKIDKWKKVNEDDYKKTPRPVDALHQNTQLMLIRQQRAKDKAKTENTNTGGEHAQPSGGTPAEAHPGGGQTQEEQQTHGSHEHEKGSPEHDTPNRVEIKRPAESAHASSGKKQTWRQRMQAPFKKTFDVITNYNAYYEKAKQGGGGDGDHGHGGH